MSFFAQSECERVSRARAGRWTLVALAATAACGQAAAVSVGSVTLYGEVDAFTEWDSGGSQGSRVALESGGLEGTRWGMKGDLGLPEVAPDLKAIFQLEGGLFVNNGKQAQGGRLFGRQAYAGITGNFGTLTAGRQYTPLNNTVWSFDSFGQGFGSPNNDGQVNSGLDSRYDNAIIYATPTLQGFSANAMVALGGKTGQTSKNAYGGSLGYAAGAINLGLAFQRDDHDLATNGRQDNLLVGASYNFGKANLMGAYSWMKTAPDGAASHRRNGWLLGSQIDVTDASQVWLDYGTGKTSDVAPSDRSQAYSVAWVSKVNKQLRVYAVGSIHKNDDGASLVPVGTSSSDSYTVSPGNTARGVALGFIFAF